MFLLLQCRVFGGQCLKVEVQSNEDGGEFRVRGKSKIDRNFELIIGCRSSI